MVNYSVVSFLDGTHGIRIGDRVIQIDEFEIHEVDPETGMCPATVSYTLVDGPEYENEEEKEYLNEQLDEILIEILDRGIKEIVDNES